MTSSAFLQELLSCFYPLVLPGTHVLLALLQYFNPSHNIHTYVYIIEAPQPRSMGMKQTSTKPAGLSIVLSASIQ